MSLRIMLPLCIMLLLETKSAWSWGGIIPTGHTTKLTRHHGGIKRAKGAQVVNGRKILWTVKHPGTLGKVQLKVGRKKYHFWATNASNKDGLQALTDDAGNRVVVRGPSLLAAEIDGKVFRADSTAKDSPQR